MGINVANDLDTVDWHARLIRALCRPAAYSPPVEGVELVETHISWVLLAGAHAYKVKKPVNLGFLDFSTLERRRFFCEEEVRLNRRLAAELYLGVVPITGSVDAPRIGGDTESLEYAVAMRRFPQRALLTHQPLDDKLIDALAERVARFHIELQPAPADSPFGTPGAALAPMRENFAHVRAGVDNPQVLHGLARLERWTESCYRRVRGPLEQRRRGGFIRECHGDLHRGNIAVVDGVLTIFDCIEFSPQLRWIDTMSELAFLTMDLCEAGETALARRLLNRYLQLTGDYAGLVVLPFYQVYRAMVRAKVIGIRLSQDDLSQTERDRACAELKKYLRLARMLCRRGPPRLFITCGLSGSGKTCLGNVLREHLPMIQISSDAERKRLFGLSPCARTNDAPGEGIYTPEASRRTYARLAELAAEIIAAGYSVLVDATFLTNAQRDPFRRLAAHLGCSFTILALDAPEAVLRQRIEERLAAGNQISEADVGVLELQLAAREPLREDECSSTVFLDTTGPLDVPALLERLQLTPS